jgi:hypothetical protein
MLMQIKHYYFEPMDESTIAFDLLINTDQIIRVNRAVATESTVNYSQSFVGME